MDISELTYDPDGDVWIAPDGGRFIKNVFVEDVPVWIEVGEREWRGRHLNVAHVLHWPPGFPPAFLDAARRVIHARLKKQAPSSLSRYSILLGKIQGIVARHGISLDHEFGDINVVGLIWSELPADPRIGFRELYRQLAAKNLCGTTRYVADRIQGWKARRNVTNLRDVIRWDPESGALSSSELEVVRRLLENQANDKVAVDHLVRVSLRIYLATLRRPSQILQIRADGFRRIESDIGSQFFLKIPKVKGQADAAAEWECIPEALAKDIQAYRARPNISHLLRKSRVLLPHLGEAGGEIKLNTSIFNAICRTWFIRQNVISPRTKQVLSIGTTRLRHTGATQLAMQGYSRQLIQDVLQHDNPGSAKAYIDSVGADTLPLFEQMNDRLGSRFSDLRNAWFQGRIIDANRSAGPPIIVPGPTAPAVVGACGNAASCRHHPLFSCYLCQYFLAFRQADHVKALDFIEHEFQKWRETEIGASRSKAMKDFERTAAGIQDVMDQIDREIGRDGV